MIEVCIFQLSRAMACICGYIVVDIISHRYLIICEIMDMYVLGALLMRNCKIVTKLQLFSARKLII